MLKWVEGRQNSGYWKMPLVVSNWLKFDAYLLKFENNVKVPWHTDPTSSGRHFRLNIYLKRPPGGGDLKLKGEAIFNNRLFHLFRPDIVEHSMTKVEGGTLYMLSIGKVFG